MACALWLGALGCKKHPDAEPARVPLAVPERPPGYEVEIWGALKDALQAPRYIVLLTPSPCDPAALGKTYVSSVGHPDPHAAVPREFFLEPVVRDGDQLYLCGAALDEKGTRVLGFGAYAKNPIRFVKKDLLHADDDEDEDARHDGGAGDGDVEIKGLTLELAKLPKPVSLPFDRF